MEKESLKYLRPFLKFVDIRGLADLRPRQVKTILVSFVQMERNGAACERLSEQECH